MPVVMRFASEVTIQGKVYARTCSGQCPDPALREAGRPFVLAHRLGSASATLLPGPDSLYRARDGSAVYLTRAWMLLRAASRSWGRMVPATVPCWNRRRNA